MTGEWISQVVMWNHMQMLHGIYCCRAVHEQTINPLFTKLASTAIMQKHAIYVTETMDTSNNFFPSKKHSP